MSLKKTGLTNPEPLTVKRLRRKKEKEALDRYQRLSAMKNLGGVKKKCTGDLKKKLGK